MQRSQSQLWSDLGFSLLWVYSHLQRKEKEVAARHQLGPTHLEVLFVLARLQSLYPVWIPARLVYPYFCLTQPAIGRILRHLAYWRFVELVRDKRDRRRQLVRLLPKAHQLLDEIAALRTAVLQDFFSGLSPRQLRKWTEALQHRTFERFVPACGENGEHTSLEEKENFSWS
ncbi:MAG: MarR family transcriptional regulator [Bacteroidetes bacterium]|nr:MAG: MarR family transcriptional regulator [Bacteroidota bacterium]